MGEVFKPGIPPGRDVAHLLPHHSRVPPAALLVPRFRLKCVKCGRVFEDVIEAYRHQNECPDACFKIMLG